MIRDSAITYDGLPISSGGAHSLRQKGFVAAFEALQKFVDSVSLKTKPRAVYLELFEQGHSSYSHFLSLSSEFDKEFQRKDGRHIGEFFGHQWEVDSNKLKSAVYELERLRPISNVGYAGRSLVLHVYWDLVFADIKGQPLPFQSRNNYLSYEVLFGSLFLGESSLYSRISEDSTANLFLSLPFDQISGECTELVDKVRSTFPARLSSKHWKLWSLTKKKTSYVGRNMAAPFKL